ncbi:MAG TPA: M48 family metallopeptidase [Burkholderiales bacterium]|nr:M48 family metallopeptidase [Burkholderiales bacterium]
MGKGRLVIAGIIALFAIISYFGSSSENPLTGEKQRVAMTPEQEIALGYQSASQMAAQMGGVSRNAQAVALVQRMGDELVRGSFAAKSPYKFSFHVLADPKTVNAFALPGGPVFITEGLLRQLKTEAELAGVLGHEIGHVIARHSSERLAKQQLTQGLLGALVVGSGDYTTAQIGQVVGNMINMSYGRDDELESDALGIRIMAEAGYDPRGMVRVMEVLAKASGGSRQPEFVSTHPAPENRSERIKQEIAKRFPNGVPGNLKK